MVGIPGLLCPIAMMTFTSPDLEAVEARYEKYLGYEVRAEGTVSEALAKSWGAANAEGKRYILMGPESGDRVYLRAIEGPAREDGTEPIKTYGWTTAEIIVRDAYTLSASLRGSPFEEETANRVIRLNFTDHITNFRVVGPDGEAMYLSQIDGDIPNLPLNRAESFVDETIMTVNTSKDPAAARMFYEKLFNVPALAPFGVGERKLNIVPLGAGCLVEIDPPADDTKERNVAKGELPSGMAMASYYMESLDRDDLDFVKAPRVYDEAPYVNRRAATVRGPSGELIELIEFKMTP